MPPRRRRPFSPATVLVGRSDEFDLASMARKEVAADLRGVRKLLGGQKPALRKPFLDRTKLFYVGGGWSRVDVCDEFSNPSNLTGGVSTSYAPS